MISALKVPMMASFSLTTIQIGNAIINKPHIEPINLLVDNLTIATSPAPVIITGIAALVAGASSVSIVMNTMKANMLIDELNYRNSNQEEQQKVYQKEINHTR